MSPYPSWQREDFEVSANPMRVDLKVVHGFLTNSYWAKGIPLETVQRSLQNSLCFGIYLQQGQGSGSDARQVGFARVITDRATFAYLADVFVLDEFRGRGLSKWLMECIVKHPELQGLRRWCLVTRDAHGLYEQFGFKALPAPERWMERNDNDPEVYARNSRPAVP